MCALYQGSGCLRIPRETGIPGDKGGIRWSTSLWGHKLSLQRKELIKQDNWKKKGYKKCHVDVGMLWMRLRGCELPHSWTPEAKGDLETWLHPSAQVLFYWRWSAPGGCLYPLQTVFIGIQQVASRWSLAMEPSPLSYAGSPSPREIQCFLQTLAVPRRDTWAKSVSSPQSLNGWFPRTGMLLFQQAQVPPRSLCFMFVIEPIFLHWGRIVGRKK